MKEKKLYTIVVLILLSLLVGDHVYGQSVSAIADREKILLGEQIKLTLKSENVNAITNWFAFPDTVNHIEVVERGKIDTIEVADIKNYQQVITLTSFDSGRWQIPELQIQTAGAIYTTQPIAIEVIPVDVSQLENYHDIKEIVEVEQQSKLAILLIIAALTLIALAAVWYFMRKKRLVNVEAPVIDVDLTPQQWANSELDKLQQENLPAQQAVKQHYQRLTDICRQYFYLQLRQQSLHQTTDEWMINLQPLPVRHDAKTSFLQLLRLADTVKFAKYLPPAEENDGSINIARQMVEQVASWHKTIVNTPKKSN